MCSLLCTLEVLVVVVVLLLLIIIIIFVTVIIQISAYGGQERTTAVQQLINFLQRQKTQQGPQAIHNKSLEQLLQEPSILAPLSQPSTAVPQSPTVTHQVRNNYYCDIVNKLDIVSTGISFSPLNNQNIESFLWRLCCHRHNLSS